VEEEEEEDTDTEDQEDAATDSESESASNDDTDSDNDNDELTPGNTSAAKTAVGSPAENRKRRLQELEDFVKSKSASDVKGILKSSAPSSAGSSKLVKFSADENTDTDSRPAAPVYREDIYGRLRDEHGNVVNPDEVGVAGGQGGAYVPPGKRRKLAEEAESCGTDKSTSESKQRVEVLTRQVKGQINRSAFVQL